MCVEALKVMEILRPAHLDDMEPLDLKRALDQVRTEGVLPGQG